MFEMPDLAGLGAGELDALLATVREESTTILSVLSDPATADSADLDRLEMLAGFVDSINAELAVIATALAARTDRAAALSAKFATVVANEAMEDGLHGDFLAAADRIAANPDTSVEPPIPLPVVAAIKHPNAKAVVANAPKPVVVAADERKVAIVASAGVPGYRGGQETTLMDMVKPAVARWSSYNGLGDGLVTDALFQLKAPARDPRLIASGQSQIADTAVMKYAADQHRISNPTTGVTGIIAAGGWCAPAEQRFDVCTLAELDGILNVPTIQLPRGSISYFRQLDYSTVNTALNASGLFSFTNAQLVNVTPPVKPCFEIPCLSPVTATLDARGLCLRAGILQQKAFPELIEAWLDLALIAYAHYLNTFNLAEMVAGSTAVAMPGTFGSVSAFLEAANLQAIDYRLDNGMRIDHTLEMVLPFWVPELLKADWSRRQFVDDAMDFLAYDKAQLVADLGSLNIMVQFVKDLDDAEFTGAALVNAWPGEVRFLLYAAGAWIRGTEDIISVSTLYDSTLLTTNRVQLLFIESGSKMLPWCGPSRYITLTTCPSGATAGPIATTAGAFTCPTVD